MLETEEKELPPTKTNWPKVYLLVLGWLVLFVLFMYFFTKVTE